MKFFSELKEKEALLKDTQAIGNIGGWILNIDKKTLLWTDHIYKLHNLPTDYKPNLDDLFEGKLYDKEYVELLEKTVRKSLETLQPWELVVSKELNGKKKWYRLRGNPTECDLSGCKIMIGTTQDITNEIISQNKIEHLLEQTMFMCDNVDSIGMWYKDNNCNYVIADSVLRKTLFNNIDSNAVTGKSDNLILFKSDIDDLLIPDFNKIPYFNLPDIEKLISKDIDLHKIFNLTDYITIAYREPCRFFEIIKINDKEIALDMFKTPVYNDDVFIGTVGAFIDVTKVKNEKLEIMERLSVLNKAFKIGNTKKYYIKRYI